MGGQAASRGRRYGGQGRRVDAAEARFLAAIRTCCISSVSNPHAPDCEERPNGCRDKVGYITRDEAQRIARGFGAVHRKVPYRCGTCAKFHVGRPPRGKR
jgi:hypothetical protein